MNRYEKSSSHLWIPRRHFYRGASYMLKGSAIFKASGEQIEFERRRILTSIKN